MDERLPQTIAEAFACKFPEWNAEKFTRRGESCKSVDIEDVDDLKIFTDSGLEKLDVSETVRSALRAVKADLVPPASSPSKHSAVSFDEDVCEIARVQHAKAKTCITNCIIHANGRSSG